MDGFFPIEKKQRLREYENARSEDTEEYWGGCSLVFVDLIMLKDESVSFSENLSLPQKLI